MNPGTAVTSKGMMIALLSLLLQAGHVFEPVDPSWRLIEDTLEVRPDFFVVADPQERKPRNSWRDQRYLVDGKERKYFRYDPQGKLRVEADIHDGEQFTRILRADGSLAAYHHHRNFRLVEAWSISRDGKTRHHVQDGLGELVSEGEDGAWSHTLMLPGVTIEKAYRNDRLGRISIWIGSDHGVLTPEGEALSLAAPAEHWTIRGGSVDLEITALELVDGKVRGRPREANPDVRPRPAWHSDLPQGLLEEWAVAWPKRRAAFVARVDEALNAAEQDWGRLGLDFIRDGSAWPK